MKKNAVIRGMVCCAVLLCSAASAPAQQGGRPANAPHKTHSSLPDIRPVVPLTSADVYAGWRVSHILGRDIVSGAGGALGTVRNVLLNPQGKIEAFLVESAPSSAAEFIYRIPWERVNVSALPGRIVADVPHPEDPALQAFRSDVSEEKDPSEFRVSEIVGDYARLQSGLLYGYVSDVVFSRRGEMTASLVLRTAAAGGGTYAFGFPGTIGAWNPRLSYYGLPYVTADQATGAGLLVKADRFKPADAG
jgi:sporulation protein YlmC with PRC-barrel domain